MLDAIASDPRIFQVQFEDNASGADRGPDSGTGLDTYAVLIDYDWVESALTYVAGDGVAQKFSAEAMLAHELAHLYYWDDPDGKDPFDINDSLQTTLQHAFDADENKGRAVEMEASVQVALGEGQRISYFSAAGKPDMPTSLKVGYDYSPAGFGSGVVDVVFVDANNQMSGSLITLSNYSATDRYLLVLGSADNWVVGGNLGDYIHTSGGIDFVGVSAGSDYLDGGSGESPGGAGDTLKFINHTGTVTFSLASGTGIEGDAIFAVEKSAAETDHFTDFENLLFGEEGDRCTFDGDEVLNALAAEDIKIIGGDGRDKIDGSLLQGDVVIDLAAGEMYLKGETDKLTLAGFEDAVGGKGSDTIAGDDQANVLAGGLGADTLVGGGGNDLLVGGGDGDTISGGDGFDLLVFAPGDAKVRIDFSRGVGLWNNSAGDHYSGIEGAIGTNGQDVFISDGDDFVVVAGGGERDNFLVNNSGASSGVTVAFGGAGSDIFRLDSAGLVMLVTVNGLTEENFHSLTPSALEAAIGAPLE